MKIGKIMRPDHLTRFKPQPDSLAPAPVSVALPKDIDRYIRALPNRSEWLRQVISEAVAKEQAIATNPAQPEG